MKSVCIIFGTGCSRARQDTRLLTRYFERNSWQIIKKVHSADLIAISLCGFLGLLESQSFKLLHILRRKKKKHAQILAVGCLAGIKGVELEKKYGIIPINLKHPEKLDEIISAKASLKDVLENPDLHPEQAEEQMSFFSRREMSLARFGLSGDFLFTRLMHLLWKQPPTLMKHYDRSINIRIARGCEEDCTYCAIKTASGRVQSLPLESVLREFRNGLSHDYQMFNLMGEDVGAYGQDIGMSLVDLLESVFAQEGNFKIGFLDCSPRWLVELSPRLSQVLCANKDKIAFLGFPLQSGSNKILESMKRNYKAEDVADCVLQLHRACPDLDVVTHVMVGFPGESAEDFEQTLEFVRKVPFKRIYVFRYSDRPNTESARFPDKVNPIAKNRRFIQFLKEFHPISHF